MTQPQEETSKDLNWFLSEYDRKIDVISSNLNTLKEELHKKGSKKEETVATYQDIIKFKIDVVYSLLIKLEELIFSTTFAYYRKYYGSLRREFNPVEFEDTKREASYIFDSFLSQYKSLLDLSIKFASKFAIADLPQVPKNMNIDSFERMLNVLTKKHKKQDTSQNAENYRFLVKSGRLSYLKNILGNIIQKKATLEQIKHYRDYTIHHGYFRHQLKGKAIEGHFLFSYWIPTVTRAGKKNYNVNLSSYQRLDEFCRDKFHQLLLLLSEMTDLIYDGSFKQPYIKKLSSLKPELVKETLLRISRKGFWADRAFLKEEELKDYLKSKGIDFSELIVDFTYSEGNSAKTKKKDETLFPMFQKVFYKPIGNITVFKNTYVISKKKKSSPTKDWERPTYAVTVSSLGVDDLVTKDPKLEDVFDTLLRAGLVYGIETKNETRYASIRDDLKALVFSLKELSDFKWSRIQVPEFEYFRPRTQEETENTRRILGDKTDAFLKKEDEQKKELQKEYEEWKKEPVHYFKNCVNVIDKDKNIVSRITHRDFLEEQKDNFRNWKEDKLIVFLEENGNIKTEIVPLAGEKAKDPKWLDRLIKTCKKQWKGKPRHDLDLQKKWIRKSKKDYNNYIKKTQEQFAPCIKKYNFLEPILRLLNSDVFDN